LGGIFGFLNVFDDIVYPFFSYIGLFSLFFDNNTIVNLQYARIFVYFFEIIILISLFFFKKIPKIPSLFLIFITFATLFITLTFHFVLIEGALRNYANKESQLIMRTITLPYEKAKVICEQKKWILYDSKQNNIPLDSLNNSAKKIYEDTLGQNVLYVWKSLDQIIDSNIRKSIKRDFNASIQGFSRNNEHSRFIIDNENYDTTLLEHMNLFYTMVSIAYFFWVWGGTGVLFFHLYKFSKRRQM